MLKRMFNKLFRRAAAQAAAQETQDLEFEAYWAMRARNTGIIRRLGYSEWADWTGTRPLADSPYKHEKVLCVPLGIGQEICDPWEQVVRDMPSFMNVEGLFWKPLPALAYADFEEIRPRAMIAHNLH